MPPFMGLTPTELEQASTRTVAEPTPVKELPDITKGLYGTTPRREAAEAAHAKQQAEQAANEQNDQEPQVSNGQQDEAANDQEDQASGTPEMGSEPPNMGITLRGCLVDGPY